MSNQPTPNTNTNTNSNATTRIQQMGAGTIGLLIAAGALLIFILQNRESEKIEFLMIDLDMPLWLLIVISAVLGAIIARLAGWLIRRSKSKDASAG